MIGLHGFEQIERSPLPSNTSDHVLVTPEGYRFRVLWDWETLRWQCGVYDGGSIRSLILAMRDDFPGIQLERKA